MLNRRKRVVIHPDVPEATEGYRKGNKNAFKELGQKRTEQMRRTGQPYWDTTWDEVLRAQIETNTKRARDRAAAEGRDWDEEWERAGSRRGNMRILPRRNNDEQRQERERLLELARRAARNEKFYPAKISRHKDLFREQQQRYERRGQELGVSRQELGRAYYEGEQEAKRILALGERE